MPNPHYDLPPLYIINIATLLALEFSSSILATIEWLEWVRDSLESEVTQELDTVMEKVLATAIELCPKDTGSLASSISLESGVISAGDFAGYQIYAGSEDIINPKSGMATSEYASLVHDGHAMRDGTFWEGIPFLDEALLMYFDELENAINRALQELGGSD